VITILGSARSATRSTYAPARTDSQCPA